MFIFPMSLKDDLKQHKVGMIVLDMYVSNGILVGPYGGPWELAPNWNEITVYVVGDFVSVRNLRVFTENLSIRQGCSFNIKQVHIRVFSKVLSQFVEVAGDWHVGIDILVTIFSLFSGGVLQDFQQALNWRRIQSSPTTCYQSSALLVFSITGKI